MDDLSKNLCGADCSTCSFSSSCRGCESSCGKPFGGRCITYCLIREGGDALGAFRKKLLKDFNSLGLEGAGKATEAFALPGFYVNMELPLPDGSRTKFLSDDAVYLGGQVEKAGTDRCYGFAADDKVLVVMEYGEAGKDPVLVEYRRR